MVFKIRRCRAQRERDVEFEEVFLYGFRTFPGANRKAPQGLPHFPASPPHKDFSKSKTAILRHHVAAVFVVLLFSPAVFLCRFGDGGGDAVHVPPSRRSDDASAEVRLLHHFDGFEALETLADAVSVGNVEVARRSSVVYERISIGNSGLSLRV